MVSAASCAAGREWRHAGAALTAKANIQNTLLSRHFLSPMGLFLCEAEALLLAVNQSELAYCLSSCLLLG